MPFPLIPIAIGSAIVLFLVGRGSADVKKVTPPDEPPKDKPKEPTGEEKVITKTPKGAMTGFDIASADGSAAGATQGKADGEAKIAYRGDSQIIPGGMRGRPSNPEYASVFDGAYSSNYSAEYYKANPTGEVV
jgi:hypothetical protein